MGSLERRRKEHLAGDLSALGNTEKHNVGAYRHINLVLVGSNTAAYTVKVKGALRESGDVDFTSAAALDNEWDYVASYNLNDPSSVVPGETGYTFAGDVVEQIIVNTNALEWVGVEITSYTSGDLRCYITYADNE